jgi:hypothetical protein
MYYIAKFLQATGITSLLIGLILGLQGNMRAQYYYFFAGIGIFFIGWLILKGAEKRAKRKISSG